MTMGAQNITMTINFRLNGIQFAREVPLGLTLLRYIRDELGYTGAKCGCEVGECGACTVLYNGQPVNACLILAAQIDGAEIWTIEGVAGPGPQNLHPVQQAFLECDAVHCGFCSPGMVMTAIALFLKNNNPDEATIRQALAGNLCRCTGYIPALEAIRLAAVRTTADDLMKFNNVSKTNVREISGKLEV